MFACTVCYELSAETPKVARTLLHAALVARRYLDHFEGQPLPAGCLWARKTKAPEETVDDVKAACERDLAQARAQVEAMGHSVGFAAVWVVVLGGGTFGLAPLG